jgi:membrane fusion protein (multidrug efflux system)
MNIGKKQKLGALAGALALILIATFLNLNSEYEDTDNAYTAAHVATLSPKVSGIVTEVLVEENYKVKKDQVLVRIDPRDFRNALDNLKAQLGGVEASLSLAQKDYKRSAKLYTEQAVTEQDKDNDFTKVEELNKKRDALRSQIAQADLNLSFTEIKAPSDGTIGKKLVEPGMVLNPGQPLLSFVDSQAPWVIANFKETQLRKMKIGQKAEIEIDSIGGKKFEGIIESFAPGSGATFALIPPDNATGNFTKIVQRVPVRIRFLEDSIRGYEERIVPGLSAEAKIDLQSEEAHSENPGNSYGNRK